MSFQTKEKKKKLFLPYTKKISLQLFLVKISRKQLLGQEREKV